jgi:hypothetical protein
MRSSATRSHSASRPGPVRGTTHVIFEPMDAHRATSGDELRQVFSDCTESPSPHDMTGALRHCSGSAEQRTSGCAQPLVERCERRAELCC